MWLLGRRTKQNCCLCLVHLLSALPSPPMDIERCRAADSHYRSVWSGTHNRDPRLKGSGGALMALNPWRQCGGVAAGCQLDMWVHQLVEWLRGRKGAKTHHTLLWWDTDEALTKANIQFSSIWTNSSEVRSSTDSTANTIISFIFS